MTNRLYPRDDFEASIRIYRKDEGGRFKPTFNGIRWDFAYADSPTPADNCYMIYPEFLDTQGQPLAGALPVDTPLMARMYISVDAMRPFHRQRISPGVRFYCQEGNHRVAEGVATRVTQLTMP